MVQASQSMYPRRNCKTPGKSAALHACGDKEWIVKSNPEYPANVIPNQRTHTGKRALMKGETDASLKQVILPTEYNAKNAPQVLRELRRLARYFQCSSAAKGRGKLPYLLSLSETARYPVMKTVSVHTHSHSQRAESSSEAR